jgi:hypothetical protein
MEKDNTGKLRFTTGSIDLTGSQGRTKYIWHNGTEELEPKLSKLAVDGPPEKIAPSAQLSGRSSSGHDQNLGFNPAYSSNINQGYQIPQGLHSGYGLPSKGLGAIVEGRYNAELGSTPGNLHYVEIDPCTLKVHCTFCARLLTSRLAYYVRNREFFHEGRVFSIILSEPAESQRPATGYDSFMSEVRFKDNYVYQQCRRFVVVRRKPEFCFACPIFTYSNRGTTKIGVRPEEHGIAYSDGRLPEFVKGEKGIKKPSIAVVMAQGEPSLHVASRIYYGLNHPIQYNVKVKDIGQVVEHHVPTLIGNWLAEDGTKTQQAPEVTAAAEDPDVDDDTQVEEDITKKGGNQSKKDKEAGEAKAGKHGKGDRKGKSPSKASIPTDPNAPQSPTSQIDPHLYHPRDNVYGYHSETNPHMYHPTHNPYGYHPTNNQHGYHPESNQYSYHPTYNKVGYHPTKAPFCYHPYFSPYGYHPDVTPYNLHPPSNPHGYHPDSNPTAYHPQRNPLGTKYTPTTQGHQSQSETQEYYTTSDEE